MSKLNLRAIGNFAENVCEIVTYGALMAITYKVAENVTTGTDISTAGYDDAVEAIMSSSMFSSDKREAISALDRYGNGQFYKAVVRIANDSSMFSHDKADMIRELSNK
jgi:hypothetical protein